MVSKVASYQYLGRQKNRVCRNGNDPRVQQQSGIGFAFRDTIFNVYIRQCHQFIDDLLPPEQSSPPSLFLSDRPRNRFQSAGTRDKADYPGEIGEHLVPFTLSDTFPVTLDQSTKVHTTSYPCKSVCCRRSPQSSPWRLNTTCSEPNAVNHGVVYAK